MLFIFKKFKTWLETPLNVEELPTVDYHLDMDGEYSEEFLLEEIEILQEQLVIARNEKCTTLELIDKTSSKLSLTDDKIDDVSTTSVVLTKAYSAQFNDLQNEMEFYEHKLQEDSKKVENVQELLKERYDFLK